MCLINIASFCNGFANNGQLYYHMKREDIGTNRVSTSENNLVSQVEFRGGGNIGYLNVTWPFAWLTADHDKIELGMTFVGPYTFPAKRVRSVQAYGLIPFIGWGIKIDHDIEEYPTHMVFWHLGFPETVLKLISSTGFTAQLDVTVNVPRQQSLEATVSETI